MATDKKKSQNQYAGNNHHTFYVTAITKTVDKKTGVLLAITVFTSIGQTSPMFVILRKTYTVAYRP